MGQQTCNLKVRTSWFDKQTGTYHIIVLTIYPRGPTLTLPQICEMQVHYFLLLEMNLNLKEVYHSLCRHTSIHGYVTFLAEGSILIATEHMYFPTPLDCSMLDGCHMINMLCDIIPLGSCYCRVNILIDLVLKNIERHTAHSIVSWPNLKQWALEHLQAWCWSMTSCARLVEFWMF